jgi:hypothetical protein
MWMGRLLVSGAFALLLVALSDTDAAAAEPIGTLLEDGAQVLEATTEAVTEATGPAVEPITPAMEPATSIVGPLLEPIAPDVPILRALPTLPLVPVSPPILISPADLAVPDLPGPAANHLPGTPGSTLAVVRVPDPVESTTTVDSAGSLAAIADEVVQAGATVAQELERIVDAAIPSAAFTADGATSVMAGMLIGLSMIMAAGWSALAGEVRLQPIGLRLAPPVPPG